ncbi:MAG: single-stranded DNA-binding protein [Oscillospiraceae bacterium]|nr:single-stranded DNA-binding protein [Oscillospiraceae bacterium]
MLNCVIIMGRLTADPELRTTQSGISRTSFRVAVDRPYKSGDERQTDFINVVAWRNTADFVSRYFRKGQMIAVQGSLQVRNYEDNNGNKRTSVDVVADNVSFCGSKNENGGNYGAPRQDTAPSVSYQSGSAGSFSVLPDDDSQGFPFGADDDEGLPF